MKDFKRAVETADIPPELKELLKNSTQKKLLKFSLN